MKKIPILLLFVFLCELGFCNDRYSKLMNEMKSYFIESLKNNFGDKSDDQLIYDFLSFFKEKNGEVNLVLDDEKLKRINNKLLDDDYYCTYYPYLIFKQTDDEFIDKDSLPEIVFFGSEMDFIIESRIGIYLNYHFLSNSAENFRNDAIISIEKSYLQIGIVSYFEVSDSFIKCKKCLYDENAKEFLIIVFWKYLCDLAGLEFYKIKNN